MHLKATRYRSLKRPKGLIKAAGQQASPSAPAWLSQAIAGYAAAAGRYDPIPPQAGHRGAISRACWPVDLGHNRLPGRRTSILAAHTTTNYLQRIHHLVARRDLVLVDGEKPS